MYFWVVWKNKLLTEKELTLVFPNDIKSKYGIMIFESENDKYLYNLAWFSKIWVISKLKNISNYFIDIDLLWTNNKKLASYLKNEWFIKRYKLIEIEKSDLEIKSRGIEIYLFWDDFDLDSEIFIVNHYQNIELYEEIDFWKPVSWMNVWMMPSKLAHILINIWLSKLNSIDINTTIYDPFVWFWTTWFIANYLWFNFIWSDINVSSFKQNLKWWNLTKFSSDNLIKPFTHDVNKKFEKNFLNSVDLIVTEGRLWPILTYKTKPNEKRKFQEKIYTVYSNFLFNVNYFFEKIVVVLTIPEYKNFENIIQDWLIEDFWDIFEIEIIDYPYKRKWQLVHRKIIIFKK